MDYQVFQAIERLNKRLKETTDTIRVQNETIEDIADRTIKLEEKMNILLPNFN